MVHREITRNPDVVAAEGLRVGLLNRGADDRDQVNVLSHQLSVRLISASDVA